MRLHRVPACSEPLSSSCFRLTITAYIFFSHSSLHRERRAGNYQRGLMIAASQNSEEGISDRRIKLRSRDVEDRNVRLVPGKKQELVAFELLKSANLEKLYPAT